MNAKQLATEYQIFRCVVGSHSYGTNIDSSDLDKRSVFISPPKVALSAFHSIEQVNNDVKNDDFSFELGRYVHLAGQNNPNILDILFCPEDCVEFIHPAFKRLQDHRHLFLSTKCRWTFAGYAYQQLNRIKGHKKWIENPQPEKPPSISSFCRFIDVNGIIHVDADYIRSIQDDKFLVQTFGTSTFRVFLHPSVFKEKLGFFDGKEENLKYIDIKEEILLEKNPIYHGFLTVNQDDYKRHRAVWRHYWEWKNNRNVVRAELEEKYKYDCKHAAQLVRLMTMCKEILTEGVVRVRRPDAEFLKEIRNGKFKYDELIKWAEDQDKELNKLYETSTLPKKPNIEAIDELYRSIVIDYWREKNLLTF